MNNNQILISFDMHAEMGFFKKPDINSGVYLTYNMLHKPALLGILGAICGLRGHEENGVQPQYYKELGHVKVGIEPLGSEHGNFVKTIVKYNNGTGFANDGGILNISEQILIKPSYRCYLLLDITNKYDKMLLGYIRDYKAEFIPYLGKNEFATWWTNYQEYPDVKTFGYERNYTVSSLFAKSEAVSNHIVRSMSRRAIGQMVLPYLYFEKLPIGYDEVLMQYELKDFVYSNAIFDKGMDMSESGDFISIDNERIIQLI